MTGPSDFVEKKIAEFLEKQKQAPVFPSAGSTKGTVPPTTEAAQTLAKGMSVAQFFKKVSPKTDLDRVLAAGYFLEKFKNQDSFTASEISDTIRGAKIPPPRNTNDSINKNIKKGYMMPSGDKEGKDGICSHLRWRRNDSRVAQCIGGAQVPAETFESFKAELSTLRDIVSAVQKKTVRDELLLDRFRTLFRTWASIVRPTIEPLLQSKRDFLKLGAELEALARLTSKYKPVADYRKRLNTSIRLANDLVLYLPPTRGQRPTI